jgi:CheY-like chemotaxis protein
MAAILILEDRAVDRKFLATLLKSAGHVVTEASDGADGLRLAERAPPDLVISDILMPTVDGYEFVRRVECTVVWSFATKWALTASAIEMRTWRSPVSAEHYEYLGDILTSSKHLLQLINDVLDLAKVESGKMEFRLESVDLTKLAREVCDIVRGLAASGRLQVETCVDPEVVTVVVDPARVKQMLYNYVSNAIKFTPAGGRIAIRILPDGPDMFRIDVEDTGVGIAADDLGKLFVEFQQLDASAAKTYQGTGLGLALTKKLAEAHGGRVAVRSTPGEGSTFSVILPRVMAMVPAHEVAGPVMTLPTGNRTILVVDDDPAALKRASLALREMGYRPACSADPEDALRTVAADPPGIVIVDLLMPGVDGFEFVSRFRAMPAGRDVPIIVWTVKDLDAGERRRLQPSITALVSKNAGGSHALVKELRRLLLAEAVAPRVTHGD